MRYGAAYIVVCRIGQVISHPGWNASARQNSSDARSSIAGCAASGTSSSVAGGTYDGS